MENKVWLYLVLAFVIALATSLFQYYNNLKTVKKRNLWYIILRFFTVFTILMLLIDLKYKKTTFELEKPNLIIAIDQSESIKHLGATTQVTKVFKSIVDNDKLQAKFNIQTIGFGDNVTTIDSLSFEQKSSNLAEALSQSNVLNRGEVSPIVLVSDGNQTIGKSAKYVSQSLNQKVYPVAIGDTIAYDDLSIGLVNLNRYAYLKNTFPVEIFLNKSASNEVVARLNIYSGKKRVSSKVVEFSKNEISKTVEVLLEASRIGVQNFRASITPLDTEKNISNNSKPFAIEVIDQRTNVLIVAGKMHPDIGAFKKAIESNKLRKVTITNPKEALRLIPDHQLVVCYQPNSSFLQVFNALERVKKNYIVISGSKTDWNFVNTLNLGVQREITGQFEDFQPVLNPNFTNFSIEGLPFEDFPPLQDEFGDCNISIGHEIALFQKVANINTTNPLLITTDNNAQKRVFLFGEGIWKWRAQNYVSNSDFKAFDSFIGKLVQFTASKEQKTRLTVTNESFYYGNEPIVLQAQYFDKNYEFDNTAALQITVKNIETNVEQTIPLLLNKSTYQVDLSALTAGKYTYKVNVLTQNITKKGSFQVIPFNVEKQHLNANVNLLMQIASNTGGVYHSAKNVDTLLNQLLNENDYTPKQIEKHSVVSLIDRSWILAILLLLLALEWFARKYNGLL